MYFIELIVKWINPKIKYKQKYNPFFEDELSHDENCEHIFLPTDSTGEILACTKCGLIVNKENLKDINIFKSKSN